MQLRSHLCMFSIIASTEDSSSVLSSIITLTSFIPASIHALSRLSPAISSYPPSDFFLTVSGCNRPFSLMLIARLSNSALSKYLSHQSIRFKVKPAIEAPLVASINSSTSDGSTDTGRKYLA